MENNRRKDSWHVGKEIPIAMLFAIFAQTVGVVWWAATLSAKMDDLSYQVAALTAEKYTQQDAIRDQALVSEKINGINRTIEEMKWQRKK